MNFTNEIIKLIHNYGIQRKIIYNKIKYNLFYFEKRNEFLTKDDVIKI